MRILVFSALFPPDAIGGAELSAWELTRGLAAKGHEMGVFTSAKAPEEELDGETIEGVRIWRIMMSRPYPMFHSASAPAWKKPYWHLQDHIAPSNREIAGRVLDAFKPDFVNIQVTQGIGYNTLAEIAARDIPALYTLHDLSLICIRASMFKSGKACVRRCLECQISTAFKAAQIAKFKRIGFNSPSRANLDTVARYLPIAGRPKAVILNANRYPKPTLPRTASGHIRFVYVGRLHDSKGVHVLLEALEPLADVHTFSMTVVGGGPSEVALRKRFGHHAWCVFVGHVSEADVGDHMIAGDVLCVPSVWAEPLGMVIVRALTLGVPVIGSNIGGIPELIRHDENGFLVAAGDVQAWRDVLFQILTQPERLAAWRRDAVDNALDFDPDSLVERFEVFMDQIATEPSTVDVP